MKYSNELMLNLYEQLLGSRLFEEKLIDIYAMGKVPGHIHSGVGEEAVYVGALATRKEGDYFKFTHRNVSAPNLVGMDYNTIFSEIMGKDKRPRRYQSFSTAKTWNNRYGWILRM